MSGIKVVGLKYSKFSNGEQCLVLCDPRDDEAHSWRIENLPGQPHYVDLNFDDYYLAKEVAHKLRLVYETGVCHGKREVGNYIKGLIDLK